MTKLSRINCIAFGKEWLFNPTSESSEADQVVVKKGKVPDKINSPILEGLLFSASETEFLIDVKEIVRLHILNGREITYELYPKADENDLFPFLVSAGALTLMFQIGSYFVNGSCFICNGNGVLLTGASGSGKSAVQAFFHKRGAPFIADEICSIVFDNDNQPLLIPGFPFIQVWKDIIKKLDINLEHVSKLRKNVEKYVIDASSLQVKKRVPLKTLFVFKVERGIDAPKIEKVTGMKKINLVRQANFRSHWVKTFGLQSKYFLSTAKMLKEIDVFRILRPEGEFTVEMIAKLIEEKSK